MIILFTIQVVGKLWGFNMIEEYLNRNVKSDATHKGVNHPFKHSAWLILPRCNQTYFWDDGSWKESVIEDPIKTFALVAVKK